MRSGVFKHASLCVTMQARLTATHLARARPGPFLVEGGGSPLGEAQLSRVCLNGFILHHLPCSNIPQKRAWSGSAGGCGNNPHPIGGRGRSIDDHGRTDAGFVILEKGVVVEHQTGTDVGRKLPTVLDTYVAVFFFSK